MDRGSVGQEEAYSQHGRALLSRGGLTRILDPDTSITRIINPELPGPMLHPINLRLHG